MAAGFKICTMERCSPLDERAVADLHSSGYFGATLWLSTTGINEMPTRHSSCPGAARLLDRAFQGAIVSHGGQNVALGCCQEQVALRQTQNVRRPRLWRAGSVALERYVAPTGMRHNPNAQPVNNTLGAVYIRRTPRAFACTDTNPLANSHQLFWSIQCNSPVGGPTNSRIDSAF